MARARDNLVKPNTKFIDTQERREYCIALRRKGLTWKRIAAAAIEKFGRETLPKSWDARYASKDVIRELRKMRRAMEDDLRVVQAQELDRIDRLLSAAWERVLPPTWEPSSAIEGEEPDPDWKPPEIDWDAFRAVVLLMDKRANYLGIDKRAMRGKGRIEIVVTYDGDEDEEEASEENEPVFMTIKEEREKDRRDDDE